MVIGSSFGRDERHQSPDLPAHDTQTEDLRRDHRGDMTVSFASCPWCATSN